MELTGYSLINSENIELQEFSYLPNPVKLPNGDDVHGVKSGDVFADGSRIVPVMRSDVSPGQWYKRLREERKILPDQVTVTVIYSDDPDIEDERAHMIITPLQGRVMLSQANLLTTVQNYINDPSTNEETKIAWEYAIEWKRKSPMIIAVAKSLEITDEQLDQMFRDAMQIKV